MFFQKKYLDCSSDDNKKKGKNFSFLRFRLCHVELREYIRQTSCTQLMRLYFSRISTWFSTKHMDFKNVDIAGSAIKVLKVETLKIN